MFTLICPDCALQAYVPKPWFCVFDVFSFFFCLFLFFLFSSSAPLALL